MRNGNSRILIGNCPSNNCSEKIKIRVAFKYIEPNPSNPLESPLYPAITFCSADSVSSSIPAFCGNGVCDAGENYNNCPSDCIPPCSTYDQVTCPSPRCEWCPSCSGQEWSGDPDRCIDAGTCYYGCTKDKCGATCASDADCPGDSGCDIPCKCVFECLKEGSLILTPDGFKRIEDLKEGDYVLSYNNGKVVKSKITEKKVHEGEFKLYFYKGYWFTGNHLIYLDNYKDFKPVSELSNITKSYNGKVYNIQTDVHNYFGENGLLIHNK